MTDAPGTLLVLDSIGVPVYSDRGLTATLEPIAQSFDVERSINGISYDLSQPQFQKYSGEISCSDIQSPAFGGLWPGRQVTMQCPFELGFPTATGSAERSAVTATTRIEGDHTFFRPILIVRIGKWSKQFDEWGAIVGWKAPWEEV